MSGRRTFGSLFSGIGGFDLALERAGFECQWQVELDPAASQVLARHWPEVERHRDVREVGAGNLAPVDLVCGGFPCQDLSVAGLRAGLAGERSGLFHEFMRVVAAIAPDWVLIENVPGLLSSNEGRDMGTVLGTLGQLGYGWAYRCLDAQYDGLAQRRQRVWIVGCAGDPARAAQVLFEPESLPGDPAPSRGSRPDVAGPLGGGAEGRGWPSDIERMTFVPEVGHALTNNHGTTNDPDGQDFVVHEILPVRVVDLQNARLGGDLSGTLDASQDRGNRGHGVLAFHHKQSPIDEADLSPALGAEGMAVAIAQNQRGEVVTSPTSSAQSGGGGIPGQGYPAIAFTERGREGGRSLETSEELSYSLLSPGDGGRSLANCVTTQLQVRRLTPLECERLQGFPDGWTTGQADSPRYRQIGNAVPVQVAEWIGRRIAAVTA